MPARFASTCAACGERIRAGATIAKHRVGQYVHLGCLDVGAETVRQGQARNQLTRQRRTSRRVSHTAARRQRTPEQEAAMGWAYERYGLEGIYADGERTEPEALAWAVAQYRGARLALHPDAVEGNAFGAVEAVQERQANALVLVQDIARAAGVDAREATRHNAEAILAALPQEDPEGWEIAAAINVANGRCPDGCCP